MIRFRGKCIPTTFKELVDPRYTALMIIDVQNDFCMKGGINEKRGRHLSRGDSIIKRIKLLIQEARRVGASIVYVQNTALPNNASDSAAWLRFRMKDYNIKNSRLISEVTTTVEGSWGHRIVDEIEPTEEDLIVKKNRSSAFVGTNLDLLLRSNAVRTLLMTGIATEGCVDSTARDAQFHDYFVVVLKDCVDSRKELHEAALKIMEARYDVLNSEEIIRAWREYDRTRVRAKELQTSTQNEVFE